MGRDYYCAYPLSVSCEASTLDTAPAAHENIEGKSRIIRGKSDSKGKQRCLNTNFGVSHGLASVLRRATVTSGVCMDGL